MKFLLLLLPILSWCQIPPYYSTIDFTQTGDNLKNQLTTLITNTHTTILPYTASGTTDVWDAVKLTDLDPENYQNVLLIYGFNDNDSDITTDRSRSKYSSCHTSSCNGLWVREHTYPRSLGTPNLGFEFAGSDAHHLRPIDNQRNNTRSNRKFEGFPGTQPTNSFITATGNWYPGEEWIGDIARMMMYMYLRYPTQCLAKNVGVGSTSYSNFGDMPNVFLEWNAADPVSEFEMNRNNILEGIQGNRNPFIDNPYLATLIWNGPTTTDSWGALSVKDHNLTSIVVWPTITKEIINIETTNGSEVSFYFYNLVGQELQRGKTFKEINISAEPDGIYLLKLYNENCFSNHKIIKR